MVKRWIDDTWVLMQTSSFVSMILAVALAVLGASSALAAEQTYETPPVLKASDVLPEKMQAGDHFSVQSQVQNDGYMNHYVVDSDYGQFPAYGNLSLYRLMNEIHALEQLDEVSKTKVFAQAALDSATGQVKTIVEVSKHPVGTVKGLPGGMKRMFHHYKREAKYGYKTAKDVGGQAVDVVTPGDSDEGAEDEKTDSDGDGKKESDTKELTGQLRHEIRAHPEHSGRRLSEASQRGRLDHGS